MDPGSCGAPSSGVPGGAPSLGGLESSLPHSEPPCLIVEDSQPDSLGIEDDPENSYRALLAKRLTTLQPREPSPVLELIPPPVGSRSSQNSSQSQPPVPEMNPSFEESEILDVSDKRTDSRGTSQCLTHEEGASQFGFLELSQSQDLGSEPAQDQTGTRPDEPSGSFPKPQLRPGPHVSVDVLLHSQNQEHDEMLSSQEDLFDKKGAAPDPVLPSCTPSRLALLHLSGGVQGTLVNNSLSQGSVDFVAPTPDNFTPMIVPSSPTELPPHNEPMDTSLPPTGQSERREPGPASSTPVSQNTPGFEPERPLSVPSQPDFSHDVFAPTQSQGGSSQSLRAPSASAAFSESSLNVCINTEPRDDDEEATQIEQMEDETSPLKAATNSQNSQLKSSQVGGSQGVANQAEKLTVESQNRMSSQEVKNSPETPKQGPNSNRNSQECLMLNVKDANSGNKLSPGSAKANSQPTGSVTNAIANEKAVLDALQAKSMSKGNAKANSQPAGSVTDVTVNEEAVLNASQTKRMSQESAKANSQPTGSVQEAVSGSQSNVLNVVNDKKPRNLSQGSAKANSQPTGSVTDMTAEHKAVLGASQAKTMNVDNEKVSQGNAKASSQPTGSVTNTIAMEKAVLDASLAKRMSQGSAKANSQPTRSEAEEVRTSQSKKLSANSENAVQNTVGRSRTIGGAASGTEREVSLGLALSQSQMSTPGNGGGGGKIAADGRAKGEAPGVKSLDSSGEISFHFTLPKEGELIGPSVSATPPQIGALQQAVRHSTPIEVLSLSQNSDVSAAGSDIAAEGGDADGKLSLRMKLVTPVEEGSSERFSLQRPSLTEDDPGTGSKTTAKSTNSSPSVFSRVRQVHRREPDDSPLRSPLFSLPNSQSDASVQDAEPRPHASAANESRGKNPSHHAPGAANSHDKTDPETPPPRRAGPAHRRHVRTVQEVRTTVTRIITDVYYEDGKEVDRTVTQESDEPVVQFQVMDVSPSRTGSSSLTSGDLADISSSTCTTGTTSSSAAGTTSNERPEFLPPPSRGAKTTRVPPAGLAQDSLSQASDSSPGPQSGGSSFVGLRVVAKWSSNGYFYSGRIIEDRGVQGGPSDSGGGASTGTAPGENRFRLRFDDGYECELWARDILLCDPIPLETEVTALNPDQTYTTGVVKAHRMEGLELQYCVERGEQRVWFSRGSVILSLDQGNRLREHHSLGPYQPPTGLGKASDISLDNLMEGKRKRRAGQSGLNTPTRSPRVRTKPTSSPSPSSDQSPGPAPGSKRKLGSDRTPAAKRGRRGAVQQAAALNTSDSDLAPAPCDHTPGDCGVSCDLATTHGPRPLNPALFEGFVFLLTASSERDRLSNRPDEGDDGELVQTGPYNKAYTESQLQNGGGIVLKEFNHQQCEAAYRSLLIADQHCCNRKYLLCVASGVPCVSHLWVRDCCLDNSLHNFRNYLLPAGAGPEGGVKEWHQRCSPFKSLRVLLLVEDQVQFWSELVRLGGGTVLVRSPHDQSEFPADCADVAVLGAGLDVAVDVPRVNVDWLVHSVVCGETLDFSGSSFGLDSSTSSSS
uniref:Tumor protein p53 binding protein, 1 n=1 Tax=Neogobius melanostomus TaxID=47308 RepID=A0A8C6TGR9_9GOBI